MASLKDISKNTPTLAGIANTIKKTAVKLAPKDTGNLKRQLDTYNRPSGMVKTSINGGVMSYSFELDVSPPGADYGKWWNDPTVSRTVKGKPEVNFASRAINSPEVKQLIDKLVNDTANNLADMVSKELKSL
jgi:hypothetical protein